MHGVNRLFRVHTAHRGVCECRLPSVQVALPLRDRMSELTIRARQRSELHLERFDTPGGRREFLAQMTLSVRRDLELCLGLGTLDLARGALLPCFILHMLGARKHLARSRER